jgi:hypothetical protein
MKHDYVMAALNAALILLMRLDLIFRKSPEFWACSLVLIISGLVINFMCGSFLFPPTEHALHLP